MYNNPNATVINAEDVYSPRKTQCNSTSHVFEHHFVGVIGLCGLTLYHSNNGSNGHLMGHLKDVTKVFRSD